MEKLQNLLYFQMVIERRFRGCGGSLCAQPEMREADRRGLRLEPPGALPNRGGVLQNRRYLTTCVKNKKSSVSGFPVLFIKITPRITKTILFVIASDFL